MVFRYLKNTVVFSVVVAGIVAAGMVGFFAACENPFSNSLGAKVDIEPPTITVTSPISGAYIKGVARFEGNATAYRELLRLEVKIHNSDETRPPILDWTSAGIHMVGDDIKNKDWYYDLDTLNFYGPGSALADDFLKIQFRARDKNLFADTVELVYIIKNEPSIVKFTAPSSADLERQLGNSTREPPSIGTGMEIRGTIIDRRGIKPGYPRIKIWPEDKPEPAGDAFGNATDGWGWTTLFLSGVDDIEQGTGYYADRSIVPVVRAANFVFRLSEFSVKEIKTKVGEEDVVVRREAVYDKVDGVYTSLKVGRYRFRILTSDTFFNSDVKDEDPEIAQEKARVYLWPRDPIAENDEVEAVGYYPDKEDGKPPKQPNTLNSGLFYTMRLVSSGVRPTVELNNDDKTDAELKAVPHIFMTEPTAKKTVKESKADQDIFRLRILAAHPDGIEYATLSWEHITSTNPRGGLIAWDNNIPRSEGYYDITGVNGNPPDPTLGHKGALNSAGNGKNFVFTATTSQKDNSLIPEQIFVSSTEPYTLTVTVWSSDGISTTVKYNVYLDGTAPSVSIRSIMGAFEEPDKDPTGSTGALSNDEPYIVNGNIQVSVDRSAGMGIALTKWKVETVTPDADNTGNTLFNLQEYLDDPTAANFAFFNNISEGPMSGIVKDPIANPVFDADRTYHLKFNTTQFNGQDLWLYVIAQDTVQNLGYIVQKIHVDSSTDIPSLTVPGLVTELPPIPPATESTPITNAEQLLYSTNPTRLNVLTIYEGISLTVTDDDGISVKLDNNNKSNIEVTLTDMNGASPVSINVPINRDVITSGADTYAPDSSREWIALLSQQVMANALYGEGTTNTNLADGLYQLEISVRDNRDVKVAIQREPGQATQPGDTPVSVTADPATQKFFFAVRSQGTIVKFDKPTAGSTQTSTRTNVEGTVLSPFKLTGLNITFTPDVISTPPKNDAVQFLMTATEAGREDGNYVYKWTYPNVDFARSDRDFEFTLGGDRRIEVTAVDGMGYTVRGAITVVVDSDPPDVRLAEFNFDRPPQLDGGTLKFIVNGKVNFKINVNDPNKIKNTAGNTNIAWWVVPSTAAVPTWPNRANDPALPTGVTTTNGRVGRFPVNANGANDYDVLLYTGRVGQTDGLPDGVYRLYVIAEDDFGNLGAKVGSAKFTNEAANIQEFTVRRDSDYPVLDGVTPIDGFINTITSGGLKITGSVSDDDGFIEANFNNATTTAYVQIRFPNNTVIPPNVTNAAHWGAWIPISGSALKPGAGGEIEFTWSPSSDTPAYALTHLEGDSAKYYQIQVMDEVANKNPAAPANNTGGTGFPTLTAAVRQYPLTAPNYYSFTKKDNPPQIYFSKYDPLSSHTNYSATRPTYNKASDMVADLKGGWVNDSYLDTGSLRITYSSNGTLGFTSQVLPIASSNGNNHYWNITTGLEDYLTAPFNSGANGVHTITIVAEDQVGGRASAEWSFSKDTEGPIISGPTDKVIKDETIVNGTFYDEDSPLYTLGSDNKPQQTFEYRFYAVGATPPSWQTNGEIVADTNDTSRKRATWTLTIPTLPDGPCVVEIRVKDVLDNTRVTAFTFTLDRTAPLVSPVNLMRVTVAQISGSPRTMDENERVFSASNAAQSSAEVTFTLSGLAYDRNLAELTANINPGGGGTSISRQLTGAQFENWVKNPTTEYYPPETNALFRVKKALSTDRDTHAPQPGDPVSDIYTNSNGDVEHLYVWELRVNRGDLYNLTTPPGGSNTPGERRTITVMAKDVAQRNSIRDNWRFYLDVESPTVTFLNANWSATSYIPTTFEKLNLQGTIEDDTYVKSLKYTIAKWDTTLATPAWLYRNASGLWNGTSAATSYEDPSWIELLSSTGKNVTWNLSDETLEDGRYKIDLCFTDYSIAATVASSGNLATKSLEFYVDKTPPVITWITDRKEFYRSANLIFSLSANDINGIKDPTALVRLGTTDTAVTVSAGATSGTTRPFTVGPITGLSEGTRYTLVLTVTDGAGNVAVTGNTLDFLVDNTPPTLTVTPDGGTAIVGRVEFQGKFNDTLSPISRVAFKATSGTAPSAATIQSDISGMNSAALDNYLKNTNGWTLSGERLLNGSNELMNIDPGLATAKITIPDTALFGSENNGYLRNANLPLDTNLQFDGGDIPAGASGHLLPLYFLVIDEAGNVTVLSRIYSIYPDGDLPRVSAINSPNKDAPSAERLMNGTIRISGTAVDNVRIKNVWFRVMEGTSPITTLKIPVWNQETWDPATPAAMQDPVTRRLYGTTVDLPGWYMANGGGSKSVAWWAYINTTGELDPSGTAIERNIEIQVLAEDTRLSANGIDYETGSGLLPKASNNVTAKVVKGAPRFGDEWIKLGASNNNFGTAGGWGDLSSVNLTKRASYALIVQHEMGVGAIRWNRGGTETTVNLLDESNPYNTSTYKEEFDRMNVANPTGGTGIAVKAIPRTQITGNVTLEAAKTYMIWKPHSSLNSIVGQAENVRNTIFTGKSDTINLGTGENGGILLERKTVGTTSVFEWVVVVDLYTTLLNGWTGKADWYPLNLSVSEVSKSVPLTTTYSAQIPVDNVPPQGVYTHTTNVVGSATSFGGEAGDGGTVKGLDRVVLWFSRDVSGTERSIMWNEMKTAAPGEPTAFESGTAPEGITLPTGVTFPREFAKDITTSVNRSSIVIDRNDPLGRESHHGHQSLQMGFAPGGNLGTNWYVTLNSTYITSGRVTAHYVVYDKAGNATYYNRKLMILNGRPIIANVKLATDLRGGGGLDLAGAVRGTGTTNTNNLANGSSTISAPTANYIGGARGGDGALKRIKDRFIDRVTGISATSSDSVAGISDAIAIDTNRLNDYNVVYDNTFTVRNNLLAARVETLATQTSGKTRSFRFEYVQNVRRIEGQTLLNASGTDLGIRAGRMYIIENTGSTLFPWGALGVQGEAPRRGLAFVAMEDGNIAIPVWSVENYGTPSVWELNGNYYNSATSLTRTYPTAQANLSLSDVSYPVGGDGTFAEFVYQSNAFGANRIVDYNPTQNNSATLSDFNADGRPKTYPFPSVVSGNQSPHLAHSLFIVRVFDGAESELFGDFALLSIRVNNNDKTKPYAQMYDLNPKTEGVDNPQTVAEALSPGTAIGNNRAKGGLYNENERNTSVIVKSGHIEPRTGTSLTSSEMGGAVSSTSATMQKPFATAGAYFAVDTVSGNVVVRGYAEDDTKIGSVTLEFWNENNGTSLQSIPILTNAAAITTPPTGGNKLPAVGFMTAATGIPAARIAVTEALDLNRHRVEWAYVWNAEGVDNATPVGNINIRVVASNTNSTRANSDRITRSTLNNANRTAYDYYNPTYPSANSPASTGNFYRYNDTRVNLRPYITGFVRNKADFAHDTRSRQGRYMFAQSEVVVIKGFNLGGATNPTIGLPSGNIILTDNNGQVTDANRTAFGLPTAANLPAADARQRYRVFTVPAAAATGHGMVTYTVGGYAAVNTGDGRVVESDNDPNRRYPRTTQPWNVEYSSGVLGSELWDDFTMVHIWQSNDTAPGNNTTNNAYFRSSSNDNWPIINPAMSIEPGTGVLHSSHNENGSNGNAGTLRASTNSGNTAIGNPLIQFIDPIIHSDVYYSPGNGTIAADRWSVSSLIGQAGNYMNWANLGGIYIRGPQGANVNLSGDGVDDTSNGTIQHLNNTSLYYGEGTWYNASTSSTATNTPNGGVVQPRTTDQFMNPHIITSYGGGYEHIHVSYFDDKDKSIKYRYNRRNAPGTITNATTNTTTANANAIPKVWTNLDGGYDGEDMAALNNNGGAFPEVLGNFRIVNYDTRPVTRRADNVGYTGINAGEHNAIAVTSQGYPVIAYYDATNQKLKLAVSCELNPVASRNWIIVDVLPDGNAYKFGTGPYVSIAIDNGRAAPAGGTSNVQTNRIHIAARNINGNLVYIRGLIRPPTQGTATQYSATANAAGTFSLQSVQVVDSVGTVGRWCKISLDEYGNPWIAYQDDGYIGARDGAKMAYLNTDRFTKGAVSTIFVGEDIDLYGTAINGWEAMHIPTQFRVENPTISARENGRIGMECFPTRNYAATGTQTWGAAVSYYTSFPQTRYRIVYYVK